MSGTLHRQNGMIVNTSTTNNHRQPSPFIDSKTLLYSSRSCTVGILMSPHMQIVCVEDTISCEIRFIGEKNILRATRINSCSLHKPLTKHNMLGMGICSQYLHSLQMKRLKLPFSCNIHHAVACEIPNFPTIPRVLAPGCSSISYRIPSSTVSVRAIRASLD